MASFRSSTAGKSVVRLGRQTHHRRHAEIMLYLNWSKPEIIVAEFFEVVNMTLEELESWIGILSSKCSDNDLESADDFMKLKDGLVVDGIMRRNPERRVELCTPEDIDNMRRITGYVHLHLGSPNRDSNRDRNLKRWGHDTLKTQQQ